MRARTLLPLLLLLTATTAFAQIPITSVDPPSGPTTGGTTVTIKGEFAPWSYYVYFGSVPAVSTTRLDADTLVAVTPPHLPGVSPIVVFEYDLLAGTTGTFTFEGPVPEAAIERILVPTLTPPVHGAFGSEFHTDLRLTSTDDGRTLRLFGLARYCAIPEPEFCSNDRANDALFVRPDEDLGAREDDFVYDGTPGRFLYMSAAEADALAGNLRVHDVSRAALDYGTEIPLVRSREFRKDRIVLPGVPGDARFRNTLRIYGVDAPFVSLKIEGRPEVIVPLTPGATIFDPAYAVFTDFPLTNEPFSVTIDAPVPPQMPPAPPVHHPIWAFITVTNNQTQVISTITPQP